MGIRSSASDRIKPAMNSLTFPVPGPSTPRTSGALNFLRGVGVALVRVVVVLVLGGLVFGGAVARAAGLQARNVFLITTDGLRWEEVFGGIDETLISKEYGNVSDTNRLRSEFWRPTPEARREALFPFLWGTLAKRGQIWGNRNLGSEVRVSNGHNFSYPGYSEFLTGVADARIDSNDKRLNQNTNVFEWLSHRPGFEGRVAAAANWDVMPWILNAPRSGFPVWSGFPVPEGTRRFKGSEALEELVEHGRTIWKDVMLDTFAARAAREMFVGLRPRAFYVSLGETDDWAHEGRYERVIRAAHEYDRFVAKLWQAVQSTEGYRDQTVFVLTVDHGRGPAPVAWKDHGRQIPGAASIWFAVIGPDTRPLGERKGTAPVIQAQIASTVAALVGEDFRSGVPAAAAAVAEVVGPAGSGLGR